MYRIGCPASQLSSTAMSSARRSMPSAIACRTCRRRDGCHVRHSVNAASAARAARSTSTALPRATSQISEPSTGERFAKRSPDAPATVWPSIS
jgi:hypothetical protein